MESSDVPPWAKNLLVGVILCGGAIAFIALAWQAFTPGQRAMPSEEFHEVFQKSEEIDRKNWEKMWRDAGKTPPKS